MGITPAQSVGLGNQQVNIRSVSPLFSKKHPFRILTAIFVIVLGISLFIFKKEFLIRKFCPFLSPKVWPPQPVETSPLPKDGFSSLLRSPPQEQWQRYESEEFSMSFPQDWHPEETSSFSGVMLLSPKESTGNRTRISIFIGENKSGYSVEFWADRQIEYLIDFFKLEKGDILKTSTMLNRREAIILECLKGEPKFLVFIPNKVDKMFQIYLELDYLKPSGIPEEIKEEFFEILSTFEIRS